MSIANWNPDLNVSPGTSKASLNGYLTIPFAGGTAVAPPVVLGSVFAMGCRDGMTSSADAQNWPLYAAAGTVADFFSCIWSSSYSAWFACGETGTTSYVLTSADGVTWSIPGVLGGQSYYHIVAMGATLWAVNTNNQSSTSTNGGVTWAQLNNTPVGLGLSLCAQNGTGLLAVTPVGMPTVFNSSTDGVVLTSITLPISNIIVSQPQGMCVTAGLFVVLCQDVSINLSIVTSVTGATGTWTIRNAPTQFNGTPVASIAGNGSGTWIIVATDNTAAYSTDDMATWHTMAVLPARPYRVNYSKSLGLFVAVGATGFPGIRITSNPASGWSTPSSTGIGANTFFDVGSKDPS